MSEESEYSGWKGILTGKQNSPVKELNIKIGPTGLGQKEMLGNIVSVKHPDKKAEFLLL